MTLRRELLHLNDDKENQLFGENLRTVMKIRDIDLPTLLARTRIPESVGTIYYNGDAIPDPPELQKIANVLGLQVPDLTGGVGSLKILPLNKELRNLREQADLSRDEMANMTTISVNTILKTEMREDKLMTKKIYFAYRDVFGEQFDRIDRIYNLKGMIEVKRTPANVAAAKYSIKNPFSQSPKPAAEDHGKTKPAAENTAAKKAEPVFTKVENMEKIEVPAAGDAENAVPGRQRQEVWVELLKAIDDDKEFRTAATAVIEYVISGKPLPVMKDSPQANLIFSFIKGGTNG